MGIDRDYDALEFDISDREAHVEHLQERIKELEVEVEYMVDIANDRRARIKSAKSELLSLRMVVSGMNHVQSEYEMASDLFDSILELLKE
jgi:hypothetical protein